MKTFCVQVMEVHRQDMIVEAENEKQALKMVIEGEGTEGGPLHYDYTLEPETWFIYESEEK